MSIRTWFMQARVASGQTVAGLISSQSNLVFDPQPELLNKQGWLEVMQPLAYEVYANPATGQAMILSSMLFALSTKLKSVWIQPTIALEIICEVEKTDSGYNALDNDCNKELQKHLRRFEDIQVKAAAKDAGIVLPGQK